MDKNTVYIAAGVLVLLVVILIYLRWNVSTPEPVEEEDSLPDDSDVGLIEDEDDEEFTIIDNE